MRGGASHRRLGRLGRTEIYGTPLLSVPSASPQAEVKRIDYEDYWYGLVRSRPGATGHLEEAERMADAYAEMMKKNPGGVIA